MMDVTVKTLDGQNRSFCVPENITVKQFKEKISGSISIEADIQRLIFQGRVLQDEKLLKDYDVHGKVIHVVQRPPPSTRPPGTSGTSTNTTSTSGSGGVPRGGDVNSYVVGSFTIPSDIIDPNQVQQIVQNAVQNMGDMGRNARVSTRASNDGSSVDVHIHLGQPGGPARVESESQLRINNARRMLQMARDHLTTLENPGQASGSSTESATERASTTEANATTTGSRESPNDQSESMEFQESENSDQSTERTSNQSATTTQNTETSSQSTGTTTDSSTSNNQPRSQGQGQSHPPGLIRPPITTVADVLQEVLEVNQRLQPFLVRYQTLTRNDPQLSGEELTEAQQLCNLVGEILHTISHCYHSLSDLMIDLSQPPPRHLYAAFISQQVPTTAVIQQTIPVRAQINITPGGGPAVQRTSGTQSNVPTNTAGTQANQPVTNSTGTQSNVATASAATSTTGIPVQSERSAQPGTVPVTSAQSTGNMVEGEGTPMFIEMGPEIVSVSSVTAQIVTESENPTTSSANTGTTTTEQHIFPGAAGGPVTNDLIQSIVNSVLQAHVAGRGGPRFGPSNAVQIEIGPTGVQRNHFRFPTAPGAMRMNIPAGGLGTSTSTATPSTSASSTQTNTSDSTNSSGTQTGAQNTSETQTQTPGRPRTTAFVLPGMPGGGFPGMPGIGGMSGIPGFPIPGFPPPIDPYLPCSSRYFFRQQARLNEQQQFRPSAMPGQPRNGGQTESQNGAQPRVRPEAPNIPGFNIPNVNINNPNGAVNQLVNNFMNQLLQDTNPHLQHTTSTASSVSGQQQSTTTSTPSSTTGSTGTPFTARRTDTGSTASTDPFVQMLHEASSQMPGVIGIQIQGMQDGQPMFSSMFGMPPPRPGQAPVPPRTAGTGAQEQPSQASTGGDQNFSTMLRDFLQTASTHQRTTSSSSSTTNTSSTSSSEQPAMTDEAFTRLVSGIGSMVTQTAMGQPPSQPIAEFLSSLGDDYGVTDGGFMNDLFRCVSRHMCLPDLLQVFYGSHQPLNRLRTPLREFMRGRVLNDGEPTPENIDAGVDRIIQNMQEELQNAAEVTEVKPDIDFVATLSNIFRIQLRATIRMIMQSESGDMQFGRNLYERLRQALSEAIVLTQL